MDIDIKFPLGEEKSGLRTDFWSICCITYTSGHEYLAKELLASSGEDILAYCHYHSFQVIIHKAFSDDWLHWYTIVPGQLQCIL